MTIYHTRHPNADRRAGAARAKRALRRLGAPVPIVVTETAEHEAWLESDEGKAAAADPANERRRQDHVAQEARYASVAERDARQQQEELAAGTYHPNHFTRVGRMARATPPIGAITRLEDGRAASPVATANVPLR